MNQMTERCFELRTWMQKEGESYLRFTVSQLLWSRGWVILEHFPQMLVRHFFLNKVFLIPNYVKLYYC